jgi:hypothetical protein
MGCGTKTAANDPARPWESLTLLSVGYKGYMADSGGESSVPEGGRPPEGRGVLASFPRAVCPRCKRSWNLTRQESLEHEEGDEYPVARDLVSVRD